MRWNFGWAVASVISLGVAGLGAASAADMAVKAPRPMPAPVMVYDWSGFYIGLNGGGGSSHKCWDLIPGNEGCHDATGGTVGGQLGYRWQASNWVFGLEGQGNWANFKGSNANLAVLGLTDTSKIDAFGLFTGQVGYAWNSALFYVKGGGAVVSDKYNTSFIPSGLLNDSAKETRWGGTIGAGLEFGFAPNWSVGVEYDHIFLGSHHVNFTDAAGFLTSTDNISQSVDMGTVRLNYRFGGPVVARY